MNRSQTGDLLIQTTDTHYAKMKFHLLLHDILLLVGDYGSADLDLR